MRRAALAVAPVIAVALVSLLFTRPHLEAWRGQVRLAEVRRAAAIIMVERERDLASLRWLPGSPAGRAPARGGLDELAGAYRAALLERSYALYTGDTSGLASHYAEAAMRDVLQAVRSGGGQEFVTWRHEARLTFYAPKGDVAAFTDSSCYAAWQEGEAAVLAGRRDTDVVMRVGSDGVWRVHDWRVERDDPLDMPQGHTSPVRDWPCPP